MTTEDASSVYEAYTLYRESCTEKHWATSLATTRAEAHGEQKLTAQAAKDMIAELLLTTTSAQSTILQPDLDWGNGVVHATNDDGHQFIFWAKGDDRSGVWTTRFVPISVVKQVEHP